MTFTAPPRATRAVDDRAELRYAAGSEMDGPRCRAAHPSLGYRCAKLPNHDGGCAAITDTGRVERFPFTEPTDRMVEAAALHRAYLAADEAAECRR